MVVWVVANPYLTLTKNTREGVFCLPISQVKINSMFYLMPEWFWLVVVFTFGLIIGSFLNVLIYRMHTGKSLSGYSHCLSCLKRLRWYELVPVLSYVFLRGRCSSCGSFIPWRYALVEILTASVFVLVWLKVGAVISSAILYVLVATLVVGLVYDLYHLIIPDEVSVLLAILGFTWLIFQYHSDWYVIIVTLITALFLSSLMAALWYFSGGRMMGLGDAKLIFGLLLFLSMSGAFSMFVLSFWVGAVVGLGLIMLRNFSQWLYQQDRMPSSLRVKMKSEIPFAPFMIIAFMLVFFFSVDVLALSLYAIDPLQ